MRKLIIKSLGLDRHFEERANELQYTHKKLTLKELTNEEKKFVVEEILALQASNLCDSKIPSHINEDYLYEDQETYLYVEGLFSNDREYFIYEEDTKIGVCND